MSAQAQGSDAQPWYSRISWPVAIGGFISAALFITSFVLTSKSLGSDSKWQKVQTEVVSKIWPVTIVGTVVFFITSALYVLQEPKSMMYFILVVSCLSLGMAYSSLVISVINV
jgi:hypothetical protein